MWESSGLQRVGESESGLLRGDKEGVIVEMMGEGVGIQTSGDGKDFVQGRTKGKMRDHTNPENWLGRIHVVVGEGKFPGTF